MECYYNREYEFGAALENTLLGGFCKIMIQKLGEKSSIKKYLDIVQDFLCGIILLYIK
jgi:hypothetical protein